MKPTRCVLVLAALAMTACGAGGDAEDPAISAWLNCEECIDGERAAVAALGSSAVAPLTRHLEGPSSRERARVAAQLDAMYSALQPTGVSRVAFVDAGVANHVARYQSRAATSLGDIATSPARNALQEALAAASARRYRDDVVRAIGFARNRIGLAPFGGSVTPDPVAYGDTVSVSAVSAANSFATSAVAELDGAAFTGTEVLVFRDPNLIRFIATGDPGQHVVRIHGMTGSTDTLGGSLVVNSLTDANDRATRVCGPSPSLACLVTNALVIQATTLPDTSFLALQRRSPSDTVDVLKVTPAGALGLRATLDWVGSANLDLRWRRCADHAPVGNAHGITSANPESTTVVIPAGACWALYITMPGPLQGRARARLTLHESDRLTAVGLTGPTTTIPPGGSVQLTATPVNQHGSPIGATLVYSSSVPAVATVTADGRVTGVGAGVATIMVHATLAGITVSAAFAITVVP